MHKPLVNIYLKTNMTCKHKFYEELKLEYVNWEVKTLFIGTFNPGCCNENDNVAQWFYGRTQNNMFWDTLGYIYANNPLLGSQGDEKKWKLFCKEFNIAVTDLIFEITDFDLNNSSEYKDLCNEFTF
jgi:hypothetical protein